jgi:polyhydroxyalkanoate synthesis repressor PhaR
LPLIKRYPNRKLYDTEAKQYITLEGIGALIREGKEVQVVDYATGEDQTSLTLTQVIFELERKRTGFLPRGVLTGLIQAGGETLSGLRRGLAFPLDLARHVDEEIERRLAALVRRGDLGSSDALHLRDQLLLRGRPRPPSPLPSEDQLEQALASRGLPTREHFLQVLEELERLSEKLDALGRAGDEGQPDR